MKDEFEQMSQDWIDRWLFSDDEVHSKMVALAELIRGQIDHRFVDLNLRIVDLEDALKETIECDNENILKMTARIAELEKMLLQPFCTEHRKHIGGGGFCDECNGDRNLIQPRWDGESKE